ncbi:hypothetical protein UF75_2327 [Desulfosporosinus sp. I2]|nr:hypothetical protein UF75_2327 [Desulfosporosinus sp. I2]
MASRMIFNHENERWKNTCSLKENEMDNCGTGGKILSKVLAERADKQ